MPLEPTLIYPSLQAPVLTPEQEPEQVTESRWHQPWSEPVKTRIAGYAVVLSVAACVLPYFSGAEIITPDKWFANLSEPVRQRLFTTALQRTTVLDTTPIPTGTNLGWYENLEQPVRIKVGLAAQLQQFNSLPTPVTPPAATLIQWFANFSEPVRLPVGLKSWLQQFYAGPPRLLPTPNVAMTMAATETNTDVLLAGINVYNSASPSTSGPGARVSIEEIRVPVQGATSLEEL